MNRRLARFNFDGADSPFFDRDALLQELKENPGYFKSLIPSFVSAAPSVVEFLEKSPSWDKEAPDALINYYASCGLRFTLDDGTLLTTPAHNQWFSQVWPQMH